MLARDERLRTASDFTGTVRGGRRAGTHSFVVYIRPTPVELTRGHVRFGFIVGKKVGGAVVRNTVKRRLRAVCASLRPSLEPGSDVVIRALPPAATQAFDVIYDEVSRSLRKGSVLR